MGGQSHTYSSISDPGYEPINSSEPPETVGGQPRYLEQSNNSAKDGKLDAITEVSEENVKVVVNSSYEPVEMGKHSGAPGRLLIEETATRADSMVDNRAYNRESYDGSHVTRPGEGKEVEKEEKEEGAGGGGEGEYEAIVALQSNSSYNYVTTMPLPSPSRED